MTMSPSEKSHLRMIFLTRSRSFLLLPVSNKQKRDERLNARPASLFFPRFSIKMRRIRIGASGYKRFAPGLGFGTGFGFDVLFRFFCRHGRFVFLVYVSEALRNTRCGAGFPDIPWRGGNVCFIQKKPFFMRANEQFL